MALAASENLAANDLLFEFFLHSTDERKDAIFEVLLRKHDRGTFKNLVVHYHELSEAHQRRLIGEGGRLCTAIREAYLDQDPQVHENARALIEVLPDYDQSPLLLGTLLSKDEDRKKDAAGLLLTLAVSLCRETESPDAERSQHDVEGARARFLDTLRQGMRRYIHHRDEIVPRAFLILADDDAPEVGRILRDGNDPCHRAMVAVLRRQSEPRVLRWFFLCLNHRHPPHAVMAVLSTRDDRAHVEYLLDHVSALSAPLVLQSLRRLSEISWVNPEHPMTRQLTEERQLALVILATQAGLPVERKTRVLAYLLDAGKPLARRGAACALAQVPGAEANQLILACLDDEDPDVRLAVIPLLRSRGIPSAMSLLLKQMDHEDERLQDAARAALSDYTFDRYIGAFDQMDDSSRRAAGAMILRIDPDARATLRRELRTPQRQHRMRAARIVRLFGMMEEYFPELVDLLSDSDRLVRREAIDSMALSRDESFIDRLSDIIRRAEGEPPPGIIEAIQILGKEARSPRAREAALRASESLGLMRA